MSRLHINLKKAFITIGCQAIPNIAYVFRDVARTQTPGWLAETPKRPHSSSSLRERSLLVALFTIYTACENALAGHGTSRRYPSPHYTQILLVTVAT